MTAMSSVARNRPITVALVDDYDVVVMGVANMLGQYGDRIVVAELDSTTSVEDPVDIVLVRLVRAAGVRP